MLDSTDETILVLPIRSEESVRGDVEESERWLAAKVTEQDEFDAEALTGTVPLVTVVVVVLEDMASTVYSRLGIVSIILLLLVRIVSNPDW